MTDNPLEPLARFGLACLDAFRDERSELSEDWLQDEAVKIGVLVERTVTEPCGEMCVCAEVCDFPTSCFFASVGTAKARAILEGRS